MSQSTIDRPGPTPSALRPGSGRHPGALLSLRRLAASPPRVPAEDRGSRPAPWGPLEEPRGPEWASSPETDRPWLALPGRCHFTAFGSTGEELSTGDPTPGRHAGLAVLPAAADRVWVVRNHAQRTDDGAACRANAVYDRAAAGGTTSVFYDLMAHRVVEDGPSLGGTVDNGPGAATPWRTWLTAERTAMDPDQDGTGTTKPHGYVFEVPADRRGAADAEPLRALGRFGHGPLTVDPDTGFVYETEAAPGGGLYRFLPHEFGNLAAGGVLQQLAPVGPTGVRGGRHRPPGRPLRVRWVDVQNPESLAAGRGRDGGAGTGRLAFGHVEQLWCEDGSVCMLTVAARAVAPGRLWEYRPLDDDGGELTLAASLPQISLPAGAAAAATTCGRLLLSSRSLGSTWLRAVTDGGKAADLIRIDAGGDGAVSVACSPDGSTLFLNLQHPGVTLAVTGRYGMFMEPSDPVGR